MCFDFICLLEYHQIQTYSNWIGVDSFLLGFSLFLIKDNRQWKWKKKLFIFIEILGGDVEKNYERVAALLKWIKHHLYPAKL